MGSRRRTVIRGQRLARRLVPIVLIAAVVVTAVVWITTPGGRRMATGGLPSGREATAQSTTTVPPPKATPTTTVPIPTTTTTDAGSLPQTNALPSSADPQFRAQMSALWAAVMQQFPASANAAFFPENAYLRLKTVSNSASDFEGRLLRDFNLDLLAAHGSLGPDASRATFVSVNVPDQYAHWIPPGVCDNGVGYFEVANSRVVYQEDGQTRSFGIASLISWRGEWYVVHLGAILRTSIAGVVLDPESGPGTSPPSSTC